MVTVDVVIVNWNAGDYLLRTVDSLARSEQRRFAFGRVVIVDNASTDGSVDWLDEPAIAGQLSESPTTMSDVRTPGGLPIVLIRNAVNNGFAAGCNQGAAGSEAEYLLFLNPDTEVEPDTLDRSVEFLSSVPDVGALGVQLVDGAGRPLVSCSRFPTPARFTWKALGLDRLAPRYFSPHFLTEFDHESSRTVDQVMGAYLLTRRQVFEDLGGFDERFFVYFEEVDYCYRLVKNGWTTYFLSSARAFHKGAVTSDSVRARRLFYSLRSRLAYGYKHFGRVGAHLQTLSTLTVEFFSRLVLSYVGGSAADTIEGYRLLWRELPILTRAPSPYTLASPNHRHPHEVSPADEVRS